MKNWLKVFAVALLVVISVFAFAACGNDQVDPDTNKDPVIDPTPSGPSNTPDLEELEEGYRVNFYYSYTAIVENKYGRTEEKNERKLAGTVYIPYDNNGWTVDAIAKKDAIVYNGYKFESWYPEWDPSTNTGWDSTSFPQVAVGDPYGFNTPVTKDINLYADRGFVAGDDIVWDIVYNYQTNAAVPPTEVEEGSHLVTFVYVNKNLNITNNISLLTVSVGDSGWSNDLLAQKTAIKYNGATFTNWYTGWDYDNMTFSGDEYLFDSTPTEDIVVYGIIGESEGGSEVTELKKSKVTLSLNGSGAMYDFANRTVIDVPWYDYKNDITNIVMDDAITYIGRNAFSGFKALKEIKFAESITKIGSYAFYESSSNFFKVLRLPDNVEEIAESAFEYTNITQLYLGNSIKTIGARAFYGSNGITYAVVPATLTTVSGAAFHPGSGNYMGGNAKHNLTKVYYNPYDASGEVHNFKNIKVDIENMWFNETPTIYLMNENQDLTDEEKKTAWYPVTLDELVYPAQYSYAVKYMLEGNLLPIATDYVLATPVKNGDNYMLNEKGDAIKIEGALTNENIDFRDNLRHPDEKYGFYAFDSGSVIFEAGQALTDDLSVTCKRFTTVNSENTGYLGGGIKWTLTNSGTVLNIFAAGEEYEGVDKNVAWDLTSSAAAQSLWTGAITGAAKIKEINIEDGIKYLGNFVFTSTGITDIKLPQSLATPAGFVPSNSEDGQEPVEKYGIASNAFDNCPSLHAVYFDGAELPESVSRLVMVNAKAYAKAPAVYNGETGAYWLEEGENITAWQLNEYGSLYVGGNNVMKDYAAASDAPWYASKDKITSISVADNITDIAENLVYGYSSIADIKLSANVKYIPATAFEGTSLINKISEYKNGLLIINGILLKVDPARRNHEFFATDTNISTIAGGAFDRCGNIKSVYISNTVKYINADAFDDAVLLTKMFIDQSQTAWATMSADWNYDPNKLQLHYKGQFTGANGQYTATICNHVYTEWKVYPPTCTADGYKYQECVFGENCIIDKNTVGPHSKTEGTGESMLDHVFENYTSNGDGTETSKCTNCEEINTRNEASAAE